MWCHFNFFFHLSCLACADGGSKIEWSEWVSSRPVIRTRCWWPPKPQCTDEDYAYIRKQCQNAILDVATGVALIAHYANSVEDDLDRALAKELTSLLKKADEYYRQKRTGEARQTMNMLISTIEVEHGKGRLSSTAADALTRQARIVISNRE
jgi:hypothetical protein